MKPIQFNSPKADFICINVSTGKRLKNGDDPWLFKESNISTFHFLDTVKTNRKKYTNE